MNRTDEGTPRMVAGRYRLESVVGRGGMGVVWRAVDTLIERRVALKELRASAVVSGRDESSFVERALREARNAGRLNHPAVVAVHDVIAPATDDDAVYVVMEYVSAPTLAQVIDEEGALPAPRVATIGLGILSAVMAAHTMGIVHRDIKPGNVLVQDGDRVKLTDFGIALAAEDTRLTRSGVIGTHAYMAPECFETGQPGPAADLWALGATLFHAVAGRTPFDRDTTTATLRAILFEDLPAPPCEPPLADVITGLMTRPVGERLTGVAARGVLQRAASEPVRPKTTVEAPPGTGVGQAAWEAQATAVSHVPPPTRTPVPPPPPPPPPPPSPSAAPSGARPAPRSPTSSGRNRSISLLVGLLVLVAVVGVAAYVSNDDEGGGAGSSAPGSGGLPTLDAGAQGTVRAYFTAMNDHDCDTLAELVTESMLQEGMPAGASEADVIADCEKLAQSVGTVSLGELDLVHEDDRSVRYHATYTVTDVDLGEVAARVEIRLVPGPSRWLIDEFGPAIRISASRPPKSPNTSGTATGPSWPSTTST